MAVGEARLELSCAHQMAPFRLAHATLRGAPPDKVPLNVALLALPGLPWRPWPLPSASQCAMEDLLDNAAREVTLEAMARERAFAIPMLRVSGHLAELAWEDASPLMSAFGDACISHKTLQAAIDEACTDPRLKPRPTAVRALRLRRLRAGGWGFAAVHRAIRRAGTDHVRLDGVLRKPSPHPVHGESQWPSVVELALTLSPTPL